MDLLRSSSSARPAVQETARWYRAAWLLIIAFPILIYCPHLRADVGVVLNESLHSGLSVITGSGHSAVYLSRICPASPVKLRLCLPGEQGSVISTYRNFGEDLPYEWNIVPLSVFLYGTSESNDRPLFASRRVKRALEEKYREQSLSNLCAGPACTKSNQANWRDTVGAAFTRSVYIFIVATSVEQDAEIVTAFNAQPNQNHFNGFTRNCADFTRQLINRYFPHAVRADYINDFGMSSPKAIARSFTRYALRHPDAGFQVLHFSQVPGLIRRSSECRDGTEQIYRSRGWLIPMALLAPYELPAFFISYNLTGRFNPRREFEKYPTVQATRHDHDLRVAAKSAQDAQAQVARQARDQERARIVGTTMEWTQYKQLFRSILDEAVREEIIRDRKTLSRIFQRLDQTGTPMLDEAGAPWLEVRNRDKTARVGLNASNILAPASDRDLAFELLLAHVDAELKSPAHSRETMLQFKQDWELLQRARTAALLARQKDPGYRRDLVSGGSTSENEN